MTSDAVFIAIKIFNECVIKLSGYLDSDQAVENVKTSGKGGLTTRFDPPLNGLRELKLHRLSANGCTKRKIFLKIFFDIRFRS